MFDITLTQLASNLSQQLAHTLAAGNSVTITVASCKDDGLAQFHLDVPPAAMKRPNTDDDRLKRTDIRCNITMYDQTTQHHTCIGAYHGMAAALHVLKDQPS